MGKILVELSQNDSWSVKVSSVIKGDVKEEIRLFASMKGTSCEISNYKVGETYVFFVDRLTEEELRDEESDAIDDEDREKIGHYESRVCSWTTLLSDWKTEAYRKQLKEFKDIGFLKMLTKGTKPRKGN